MVGQIELVCSVNALVGKNVFPRFSIFVGPEGSGKKLMCNLISKYLSANIYFADNKVDSVREVISNAYRCIGRPTIYVFADADKMSLAAKNALLKVTEEPPTNAYFIMTLTNTNNTLGTILSRGTVFYMEPYSIDEIDCYYTCNYPTYADERKIVDDLCVTPGEVNLLVAMGTIDFYTYVEKVVDNIAEVSGSNSFKIANSIKFKDTDENKYDLKLFWKAFMSICASRLRDEPIKYSHGIRVTSKYLQELRITGINKPSTFDMWLLDIREEWCQWT